MGGMVGAAVADADAVAALLVMAGFRIGFCLRRRMEDDMVGVGWNGMVLTNLPVLLVRWRYVVRFELARPEFMSEKIEIFKK